MCISSVSLLTFGDASVNFDTSSDSDIDLSFLVTLIRILKECE
jgi:hypothetical protein